MHLGYGFPRSGLHSLDDGADLFGLPARPFGQLADLLGHDAESASLIAGLRSDDGRIEREKIRLVGDVFDHADELRDLTDAALKIVERLRRAAGQIVREMDALHDSGHGFSAGVGVFAYLTRDRRCFLRAGPKLANR